MVNKKVTPEIEKFIQSNRALTANALSGLIFKKFKIEISGKAIKPHLERARAEEAANNNAKVEAVRAKILDAGDLRAEKYLKYLDENVEALHNLLTGAKAVKVETARDYVAVSQTLVKSLSEVLSFVKLPEKCDINVNVKPDLSKLSLDQLDQLESIALQLAGDQAGKSGEESS